MRHRIALAYIAAFAGTAWVYATLYPRFPWGCTLAVAVVYAGRCAERGSLRQPSLPEAPPTQPRPPAPIPTPALATLVAPRIAYRPDGVTKQSAPPLRFAKRIHWPAT